MARMRTLCLPAAQEGAEEEEDEKEDEKEEKESVTEKDDAEEEMKMENSVRRLHSSKLMAKLQGNKTKHPLDYCETTTYKILH